MKTTSLPACALLVALFATVAPSLPARADDDPSVAAFVAIKKDVEALRADNEKRRFRHHYEKLIVRLQATANAYKEGSRADDCAYVAAQLLEELATVSAVAADKSAAVEAFASMAERFPKSNLADDALVAAARLTDDVVRGRGFVDRVVAMKTADMKDEAAALRAGRFADAKVKAARAAQAKKSKDGKEPVGADEAAVDAVAVAAAPKAEAKTEAKTEPKAEPSKAPSTTMTPAQALARLDPPKPVVAASASAPAAVAAAVPAPVRPAAPVVVAAPAVVQDDVDESIALVPPTGQMNTIPPTLSQKPLAEMMVPSQLSPPSKGDHHSEVARASTAAATTTVATTRPTPPPMVLPERPGPKTPSRKVMVIRHEKTRTESVVRLRISGEVGVLRGEVPKAAGGPRKIFYDVAPAKLGQRNIQPIEVHDGVVARVRAGQYDVDIVRLVIELEGDKEPSLNITKKPFELVLTSPLPLPKSDMVAGAAQQPQPAPVVAAPDAEEVKARLSQSLGKIGAEDGVSISQQLGLRVHRVVIDAGHGGHDTGAIGPTGVREKDVTLALAKLVKDKLNAELPDIEVIMTRDDDRTLALQDRTNTANSAAADLFISIHCNASPHRRVRGVETYYLNITHDRYAMRLAARENAELGDGSISDLDFILADLAMKSNVDDSVRLGRSVQKALMKKLHQNWSDVPDLGLKHALFYVLMGNHMPSILVETSFLSNKVEERRLDSPEYQDAIANGVVDGVRAFVADRQAFYTAP
jgi:N-acetylmuramoyl-L-alanine amidase